MEDWALGGTANVMLFDPTWGTNMWNMKCCCFVGIGASGKNSILAVVLLTAETGALFQWAFHCFSKVFRVPPAIVATDADIAIEEALGIMRDDVWPLLVHLLCVFHISKNLHKNLFALFGANHKGWHKVVNMFWRIAKDSDVQCIDSFDAEWERLKELIRAEASAGEEAVEAKLVWLDDRLYRRRHKWALRFTWGHMTCGVHATQRAESNQAAVKVGLKASALVTSLVTHLESFNSTQRTRAAIADEVQRLRNARRSSSYSCAVVTSLVDKLSPYAFKLLLQQEQQANRYRTVECTEFAPEDDEFDRAVVLPFYSVDLKILPADVGKQYKVERIEMRDGTDGVGLADLDLNQAGEVNSYDCDADDGTSDMQKSRRTTTRWCSCRFPVAFGGIPCRHIIRVCLKEDVETYPIELIHFRYLKTSDEEMRDRASTLMATPAPIAGFTRPAEQAISVAEKRAVLTAEAGTVVELAMSQLSMNPGAFEKVHGVLSQLKKELLHVRADARQAQHGSSSNSNPVPVALSPDPTAPVPVPVPVQPAAVPPSKDVIDLRESLGVGAKLAEVPAALPILLGLKVAIKHNNLGSKGWFAGMVIKVYSANDQPEAQELRYKASGPCNALVHFADSDDKCVAHNLLLKTMVDYAEAPKWSWGIVEAAGLSNYDTASSVLPPARPKVGRPQTTRFQSAAEKATRAAAAAHKRQRQDDTP